MEKIFFKCRVTTPMFLGGADQNVEQRPQSLKGLLRFWWRVMQSENNIELLAKREGNIFGSAANGASASQFYTRMKFSNNINASKNPFPDHKVQVQGKSFSINILDYLAYGTKERNVFTRSYIPDKQEFELAFLFRNNSCKEDILKAFKALYLFGGMGARSRNGFGGFEIIQGFEQINHLQVPLFLPKTLPRYTAFSESARFLKRKQDFDSWDKALADLGKIYRNCREQLESRHEYEKRQYIGSPIAERGAIKSFLDRRSKPFFLRIRCEGKKYKGYILYLPSKYCDGLDSDRNKNKINHENINKEFLETTFDFYNKIKKWPDKGNNFEEITLMPLAEVGGERV